MADAYTVSDIIAARLTAAWTATPPDRLRFDDNGPLLDMSSLAPFCQAETAWGDDTPYIGEPGNRLNRLDGVLMLHFMTPRQDGPAAIRSMHANARAALSNAVWRVNATTLQLEFGDPAWWLGRDYVGIYMQAIRANRGRPAAEDGSYFGVTAAIPFYAIYSDTP
ncbi:hypothetical protein [Falsiroseomonas sp.]|uniref:hypothetical protein n=1 Tax=Falsiroseomonas sp. TaxID=2870721 RepID=UPI00273460F0|nr:hypothetical protein [Falsiroseomonas sp.]MDP3417853.1 hypothetical protein [Falsiroseomonas sp.]